LLLACLVRRLVAYTRSDRRRLFGWSVLFVCCRASGDHFLLRNGDGVKQGLHRRLAETPALLMWPSLVVAADPFIENRLHLRDRCIELLAEAARASLGGCRRLSGGHAWPTLDFLGKRRARRRQRGFCGRLRPPATWRLPLRVQPSLAKRTSPASAAAWSRARRPRSSMRRLQNDPWKIISFFEKPQLECPA
jgi:hypothetical protein